MEMKIGKKKTEGDRKLLNISILENFFFNPEPNLVTQ